MELSCDNPHLNSERTLTMLIDTRIAGIPCLVRATFSEDRSRLHGHPDSWCHEPSELDYAVLDRRGRLAPWLERKMDSRDRAALERTIVRCARELVAFYNAHARVGDYE
jgi:hypothetical protein